MSRPPLAIIYAIPARADIASIYRFIAEDNPVAAQAVVAAIHQAMVLPSQFPLKSRRTHQRGVRALPLSDYPYIVFFKLRRQKIEVLHVLHGACRHPGFQEEAVAYAF